MKKISFADMHCSLARSLDVIGDWWAPLIVRDVFLGVRRFDDLVEDLGISRNLLTRRLKHLVAKGVLSRTSYRTRPVRYEYHLTEMGADLVPAILALTAWGDRWVQPVGGPPIRFVHRGCGAAFEPRVTCSECGAPIHQEDVVALGGPGGAKKPGTKLVAQRLAAVSI